MNPEEVRELLPLYALGALSPEERSRVEEALSSYPELWAEAKAWMEAASQLAEAVPPAPVPPGLEDKVMTRIRALRRPAPWGWLRQAAAVFLILALGYGTYLGGGWLLTLREPTTQVITLVSPQGEVVGRAILRADRTALILLHGSPPKGKVFQAWGLDHGEPLPLSTFRLPLKTLRLPPEALAVAISLEPPGGSSKPTTLFGLPR
ncbi:anti-sigma factor domain-containing protein [Thermus tenuipuniceus]|uniref:anti-sigma factor n=1 Tax=Thermus tenuipuniceus TaxID=2078690 RepID=UPI000CF88CB5|nr:anti-sigma factor [Thermus tenuipuniceus]